VTAAANTGTVNINNQEVINIEIVNKGTLNQ